MALFRGIPLVVQLFIWYFGLPYIGIYLSPFTAAVLGFSLCSGAYHSEYIRGALLSIKRGQMLAAQSLGFSKVQMIFSIILPQAIRRALPGCGNEIIYLIKYSSLAYMITCIELTGEGKILASHSFKYTEVFLMIGACYLAMTSVASHSQPHGGPSPASRLRTSKDLVSKTDLTLSECHTNPFMAGDSLIDLLNVGRSMCQW